MWLPVTESIPVSWSSRQIRLSSIPSTTGVRRQQPGRSRQWYNLTQLITIQTENFISNLSSCRSVQQTTNDRKRYPDVGSCSGRHPIQPFRIRAELPIDESANQRCRPDSTAAHHRSDHPLLRFVQQDDHPRMDRLQRQLRNGRLRSVLKFLSLLIFPNNYIRLIFSIQLHITGWNDWSAHERP